MTFRTDKRIVLTLDAGGTNFRFSAMQAGEQIVDPIRFPSNASDLELCLNTLVDGFKAVINELPSKPSAISFVFPGPADYPNGIIGDQKNLPAFRGGVALGPYLEDVFSIPVMINNDADMFVYGEAVAGFLPKVNQMLADAGSPKRFNNLFGITLGTGFGCGIVSSGKMYLGDNSAAGEIWAIRNRLYPDCFAEEGASIRAVKGAYARIADIDPATAPEPKEISMIAQGEIPGNVPAALGAYAEFGTIIGDALANAITLLDGLIVIGGGLAKSYPLFIDAAMKELNGTIESYKGDKLPRIMQKCYDLEATEERAAFFAGQVREITVPGSGRKVQYDCAKRIGVGQTVLGTSQAVSLGAYIFALDRLG